LVPVGRHIRIAYIRIAEKFTRNGAAGVGKSKSFCLLRERACPQFARAGGTAS